jgi:hypothetical protein
VNPTLRRVRFLVPVHTETTPGERPLEARDFHIIAKHVADMRRRHFHCLGRLIHFILPTMNYERASFARQSLVDMLWALDFAMLSLAKVETLGGMSVFYGRPRRD